MTRSKKTPAYIIRFGAIHHDVYIRITPEGLRPPMYASAELPDTTTKEGRREASKFAAMVSCRLGIRNKKPKARMMDKQRELAVTYGMSAEKLDERYPLGTEVVGHG